MRISVVVSALSWVLALSLHVGVEVCARCVEGLGCHPFYTGFMIFQLLTCFTMCVSSLIQILHGLCQPQWCKMARIYHNVCIVAITLLLWGLFLSLILCIPVGNLSLAFDFLCLLSSMVSTAYRCSRLFPDWLLPGGEAPEIIEDSVPQGSVPLLDSSSRGGGVIRYPRHTIHRRSQLQSWG